MAASALLSNSSVLLPNTTSSPLEMVCIYAISGTYGLLPRLLYYATLLFAIFGRTQEWLILGALVSALTYAATSAIHTMALVTSRTHIFDLDLLGAYAILSTGALAYIAMAHWSTTLRHSRFKPIMLIWGILVGTALIFARVALFDTAPTPPVPACYSHSGTLLTSLTQLSSDFNCTYPCFSPSLTKPLRTHFEVLAVPSTVVHNQYSKLSLVLLGPIQAAAYAAISLDTRSHSPSHLCTLLGMRHLLKTTSPPSTPSRYHPASHEDITKHIYNASTTSWYGGYLTLLVFTWRTPWSLYKVFIAFLIIPWLLLEFLIDAFCLPLIVTNVVLNELNIMGSGLPVNESYRAVGQWAPCVSSALVVAASVFGKWLEVYEDRKRVSKERKEELEGESGSGGVVTFNAAERERELEQHIGSEQMTGVVKPSLVHVQTLRAAEDWR